MWFVFEANDYCIIEVMFKLWCFYQENLEFIGNVYYLREFEGVMFKYLILVEENYCIEMEGGFNFIGLLFVCLSISLGFGKFGNVIFFGMDWEIIIYIEFDYICDKWKMFSLLFFFEDIQVYLQSVNLVF